MPFLIQTTSSISPNVISTLSPMSNAPIQAVTSSIEMPVTAMSSITKAQFESVRSTAGFLSFLRNLGFTDAEERGQALLNQEKQTARSQRRAKRHNSVTQSRQKRETKNNSNKDNTSGIRDAQTQRSRVSSTALDIKADSITCTNGASDAPSSYLPTKDAAVENHFDDWKNCDTDLKSKQTEIQELETKKTELNEALRVEKREDRKQFNKHKGDVFCGTNNGELKYINRKMVHPGQLINSEQAIEGCNTILKSNDYTECRGLKKLHCNYWLKSVETDRNLTACNLIKTFYDNQTIFFGKQKYGFLFCEEPQPIDLHPDALLGTGAVIGASGVMCIILLSLQRSQQSQFMTAQAIDEEEVIPLTTFDITQTDEETASPLPPPLASTSDQIIEDTLLTTNQTAAISSIEEASIPCSTNSKKKKGKKFTPSLRYADPPAYSKKGFSTVKVDASLRGLKLQKYKELEAKLLESKYQEISIQQKLYEAKQKSSADIAQIQAELDSVHEASKTYKHEIIRMQVVFQIDEELEETVVTNRANRNNQLSERERISYLDELPPSYAKNNMTGYTFQTLHEFCQAKRILTADMEYWKDVEKLNDLENKSNGLIHDALKLFESSDDEGIIETNFTSIKLNSNFLSFLQEKVNVFGKEILTSIVKKQIKSIMQRFLNSIIERMAEKLIDLQDINLSNYIEEFFGVINNRLEIKSKNNILSCIEKKLQDVERKIICNGAENANKDKCEQFCNELIIEISNEYINSIFSTIKDDILGKKNESADLQESELTLEIKKFIDEVTSKLSEQVALNVDENLHHQERSEEIIEKLESNISFLSQYQKQINFSNQLIDNLLFPIELAGTAKIFNPNLSTNKPKSVVKPTNTSLSSDEQI